MQNNETNFTRRERYKGTHPKAFKDKYKEQSPLQYAADIEKVMAQGRTPAGMHRSICVAEILNILQIIPGNIGLDATLGYGGHSVEILKCLNGSGKLFATDIDPFELPRTQQRLVALGYNEHILAIRQINFSAIDQVVYEAGLLNFVLADLGVSSMQIDNPDRGFSIKVAGPLDLRLNPQTGLSAATLLKKISALKLAELFINNADEPYAEILAAAIIKNIAEGNLITTTTHLKTIITHTLKLNTKLGADDVKKTCQRCFQALRIAVNNEFGVLDTFLQKLPDALQTGGRVAIMSFHSGEDRRVKKSFQTFFRAGIYSQIAPEIIRASAAECFANPRAKSAKLRWAIKA